MSIQFDYGIVSIYVHKFPNELIQKVEIASVRFITSRSHAARIFCTGQEIYDQDYDDITSQDYQDFISSARVCVKEVLSKYSHVLVISNVDSWGDSNFLKDFLRMNSFEKRLVCDSGNFFVYSKEKDLSCLIEHRVKFHYRINPNMPFRARDMLIKFLERKRYVLGDVTEGVEGLTI